MNTSHWALVTGGSAGIGLAIARELLRREYRVILVSRSEVFSLIKNESWGLEDDQIPS